MKKYVLMVAGLVLTSARVSWALPPATAGLRAAYDASALVGFNDGDVVTAWPDSWGGDDNGTAAGYGVYTGVRYHANAQNGLAGLFFDPYEGQDIGNWFNIPSITPRQVFFVAKDMRGGGQSQVLGQSGDIDWHNNGPTAVFANFTGKAGNWIGKLNGGAISLTTERWAQFTPFDLSIEIPAAWTAYTNRICSDRDGYGYRAWGGEIYEVLLYTEPLTPEDELAVGGYLQKKWGLAGSYPVAHAELEATPDGGTLIDFHDVPQGTLGTTFLVVTLKNIGDPGTTIELEGAEFSDPRFSILEGNDYASLGQNVSEGFAFEFDAKGAELREYTASVTFHNDSPQDDVTYRLRANVTGGGVVPEPAALGLIGLALLAVRKRRS